MESTQGIEGLWDTDTQGRLVWFQTAESILTFGHLLWPTLEPLVLHLKRLLRSLQLIVQCLKQTENCAGFTIKYPTEIFLKLVQGLTDKAIRCLWDSSVSHFKPRGFCFSSTVLSLIFKMENGTSPNEVWVTQPKYFTYSDAKDWGWPVCGTRTGSGLQRGFSRCPSRANKLQFSACSRCLEH